jgi:probable HAF family extracellular repeat protein
MDMKRLLAIAIPMALLCTLIAASDGYTRTPRFTLTDLGALIPTEINNKGQIVGFSLSISGYPHAVLYDDDRLYDLGNFGGNVSEAYSLNNRGQVVGYSLTTDGCCHAFLWEDGVMTDLNPATVGYSGSIASDINNRGQIVGGAHIDGVVSGPVLWDNGEIIPLGTLGGTSGAASRINSSGEIAGWSYLAGDTSYHAFLYTHGTMMDLGTLGGTHSEAKSLNDRGQVVGYASTAGDNEVHAFLFTHGTMIDLSLLTTATGSSYAPDINNRGQVIVEYTSGDSFLYDNGTMTDLTELVYTQFGWIGFSAAGINDAGWIVGYAFDNNGYFHGILLK